MTMQQMNEYLERYSNNQWPKENPHISKGENGRYQANMDFYKDMKFGLYGEGDTVDATIDIKIFIHYFNLVELNACII